jgi:murein peptide amidase A
MLRAVTSKICLALFWNVLCRYSPALLLGCAVSIGPGFHSAASAADNALTSVAVVTGATGTTSSAAAPLTTAPTTPPAAVLSPDDMHKWCDSVTRVLPKIKLKPCMKAGLLPTGAKSVKGTPILSREVPSRITTSQPPIRVMVIGGIHGDELTSSAIVFRWLELVDQPAAKMHRWHIVPLLNPDGALSKPATRVNANGVDLNRNFPTPNWEKEARHYWVVKTASDPRRFPGKAPISEPESRWLHNEIIRFKPDVIVSIHAPFGVLDFDGPVDPPYKLGALTLMPVGIYPGSLGNYGGVHKGVPVVTIELPHALDLPSETEMKNIWNDMLAWIESNIANRKTASAGVVRGLR